MRAHRAHLFHHNGELAFSGHLASGDRAHKPWAAVVEIGRDFFITPDGKTLYFKRRPEDKAPLTFSAEGVLVAARYQMFGFQLIEETEGLSLSGDKDRQVKRKTDRRKR